MTTRFGRPPARLVDGLHAASGAARAWAGGRVRAAVAADRMMMGLVRPGVFVSGFWRSGTTWLQESLAEALDAKTVFEPLSPLHPPRRAALAERFGPDEDAAQAFIPAVSEASDTMRLLDRAMAGCADSAFGLSCRATMRESLRRRVVVKDVRAQAVLATVHGRYRVPVIHVRRHPCAVVASLVRARWHWSFARVRLRTVFPMAAILRTIDAEIADLDRDEASRIAFAWAWSERVAAACIEGQPWGRIVAYEDLVADPHGVFARLCDDLHLEPRHAASFDVPSASVDPAEFEAREHGPERWRRDLSPDDARRIETIVNAVFPSWRNAICWSAAAKTANRLR